MKVIMMLWATPCWASSQPASFKGDCNGADWYAKGGPAYPPANDQDYADVVRFVTQRWGSKLAAIELWNEPNQPMFWRSDNPTQSYVDLVRAAYPAAKAGNPTVPVLAGGMSSFHADFLQKLYDAGLKGNYDGLTVHPYADDDWSKLHAMRQQQLSNGDDKPMWLTEFGWPTGSDPEWHVSTEVQGTRIEQAFAGLNQLDYVKAAMVYTLRDGSTNLNANLDNFGLVDRNYNRKPAFDAFARALRGAPPATQSATARAAEAAGRSTVASPTSAVKSKVAKRAFKPVRLRFGYRTGVYYLRISAAKRTQMLVSVRTCGAHDTRVFRVSMGGRVSVKRRIGTRRSLAGCRLRARAFHVRHL